MCSFLVCVAAQHGQIDTNKICHSEGAEGDLVQAVMYVRNSLITSRVSYLPKTIAVSFGNHQCSTYVGNIFACSDLYVCAKDGMTK